MKNLFLILFLLLGSLLTSSNGFSQNLSQSEIKKLVKKGRKASRDLEYWKAKTYYDKATAGGSASAEHWFEAGAVYFDSKVEREKSLYFFNTALDLSYMDTIPLLLSYLGDANHYIGEFEKAIVFYNLFKGELRSKSSSDNELNEQVIRKIEICNNGIDLRGQTYFKHVEVANLGDNVNTNSADYSPVLTKNEEILLFCSRRPLDNKKSIDGEYYEDIYLSDKKSGEWNKAKVIDKSSGYINKEINGGKSHEAPISLSPDGKTLYIYKENNIWKSTINNRGEWGIPRKMNKNTNIGNSNHSIFITTDGMEMFIVAAGAKGSLGGKDIYLSTKKSDGTWTTPQNLGPEINTKYDEDAPFLSKDGKTFYFASEGHNTMGGYDIFKSERDEDGVWEKPINIGSPVNSTGNDVFYVENSEGNIAYFSSMRQGSLGYLDLYSANFECQNIPSTNINGYSIFADSHLPVSGVIKITNKDSGEEMGTFMIDPKTGKYNMVLPPDATYLLEMVVAQQRIDLKRSFKEEFYVPKQCESYNLFQQISLANIKNDDGAIIAQSAKFQNAFFDIENEVKDEYNIDNLASNSSYTDSLTGIRGTLAHNESMNAEDVEINLLNLDNEIIRVTKTNSNGDFAFENLDPNEDYIVLINEGDAIRSYQKGTSSLSEEVPFEGFIQSYHSNNTVSPKPNTSIYIANDNNEIVSNVSTKNSGYFELTNTSSDPDEISSINDNTTISYNMDIPTKEVLFSAYLIKTDPNNSNLVYSEYIDIVDLRDIVIPEEPIELAVVDPIIEKPIIEEPIIEEPIIEEPIIEEPIIEEPIIEEPIIEEPIIEEPIIEEPIIEEPIIEEPIIEEPIIEEPIIEEPIIEEPIIEEPIIEEPIIEEPIIEEPIIEEPIIEEPIIEEPIIEEPIIEEPIIEEPIIEEPIIEEPIIEEPIIEEPIIEEPIIEEPIIEEPIIQEPIIEEPIIQEPEIVSNNEGGMPDFANIYFDFDKYFLRNSGENILDNLYEFLRDHPNATVRLDGHTDWIGTDEYNTTLSQIRTLVAYKYLIDKGIDPNRLDNAWFGESNPAVSNTNTNGSDSPSNRQLNRRVEIKLDIPEMAAIYIQL